MRYNLNGIVHRIANPFIFGSIIISFCTLSLYYQTYLQLGLPLAFDGTAIIVFSATLFLYNFHRLMGVRPILPENRGLITGWAAGHHFTLFLLALTGAIGVGIFIFQTSVTIFIILVILGLISLLYELPLVRYHHKFQRLRNLWVYKAFMITIVWTAATTVLPALNEYISMKRYDVWLIAAERMLFIFLLALCFDARDIDFDKKENLKTIPIRYGMGSTENLYKIIALAVVLTTSYHYFIISPNLRIGAAMICSILFTYFIVAKTSPRKSDYYYLFLVDGMMIVQFLLTYTFLEIT